MTNEELVQKIIEHTGGKENILSATNCQTRLRIHVKEDAKIDDEALKNTEGVLGIVHDSRAYVEVVVGPGKCRKCADICAAMGIPADASVNTANDWQTNKAAVKAGQKDNPVKRLLKTFGEIFVPLIPGVIAAGLCAGIASLLTELVPNWADSAGWGILINILKLVQTSFLTYLTAWAGYRAAEKFGGTPILGGMLGMITSLGNINDISTYLGWFNADSPLDSILRSGRGGVLSVVIGVFILVKIEKWIRSKMPDSLDIVFTPILTLLVTMLPYIFLIMPACGLISSGLCWIVEQICMSDNVVVRMLAGYVSAALFLPMVAMGMHHGLVALYSVQLETLGYVTLYPALAMAGAGQVGAAIAIYFKAKKSKNTRMQNIIRGAMPAGILGVGEPLIYGVTLPMGKPFLTAGLGAGFGGAFVMAMEVAATTWGPSGVLAIPIMTAGPHGAVNSMVCYAIGLVISYVMGYLITNIMVKEGEVANA